MERYFVGAATAIWKAAVFMQHAHILKAAVLFRNKAQVCSIQASQDEHVIPLNN